MTAETASPATATEVTPASPAETAATSDVMASTTEVAPAASQALTVLQQPLTKRLDWRIAPFISLKKSTIDDKVQEKLKLLARSAGPRQ